MYLQFSVVSFLVSTQTVIVVSVGKSNNLIDNQSLEFINKTYFADNVSAYMRLAVILSLNLPFIKKISLQRSPVLFLLIRCGDVVSVGILLMIKNLNKELENGNLPY